MTCGKDTGCSTKCQFDEHILGNLSSVDHALKLLKDNLDLLSKQLEMIIPGIDLEIFRTYKVAIDTLDSISSENRKGKISATINFIEDILKTSSFHLQDIERQDTDILSSLEEACTLDYPEIDTCHKETLVGIFDSIRSLTDQTRSRIIYENETISMIEGILGEDIPSLDRALNTLTGILRDLVMRSAETRNPVSRIMTGLQVHDIITQDMENIFNALNYSKGLWDESINNNGAMSASIVLQKTSTLSSDLLVKILRVVNDTRPTIESNVNDIKNTIADLKTDKDQISEYLLDNDLGRSSLDSIIGEMASILERIPPRFQYLSSAIEKEIKLVHDIQIKYSKFMSDINDLDDEEIVELRSYLRGHSVIPVLNRYERRATGLARIKVVQDLAFREALISLEEIRDLLVNSVNGIDTYSIKCIDAIDSFIGDLNTAYDHFNESKDVIDHMNDICNICSEILGSAETDQPETHIPENHELEKIFARLTKPHIATLIEHCGDDESSLTLF